MTNRNRPLHGFEEVEFEYRTSRAQSIMHQHRFDALVVTTPFDFRYFSGLDMQFWESPTHPWFLVIPATGKPIASFRKSVRRKLPSALGSWEFRHGRHRNRRMTVCHC
jgi:Xaa-Pro aminopeptidase